MIPASAGWRLQRRARLFASRCTAHIPDLRVREEIRSCILRRIQENRDDGLVADLDPRFRLRVGNEDLAEGRLDMILKRFNGLRYIDGIRFQEGLERRLVASYQRDGLRFRWKRLRRRAPVSIRLIDTRIGFGVFADRDLAEGELIGEYAGMVCLADSVADKTYCYQYPSLQHEGNETGLTIDARIMGNETRFINHTRPEAVIHVNEFFHGTWHVIFTVGSPVAQGEQILIDYGDPYWEGKPEPPDPLSP
jgi:hypothetical protein